MTLIMAVNSQLTQLLLIFPCMPHELPIPSFLADDTNNGCQLTINTITTTATTTNTIATITDDNYKNICQYTTTSHPKACNMSESKCHIY